MCCGQKRSNLQQSPLSSARQNVPRVISGNSRSQAVRTQPLGAVPVANAPQPQAASTTSQVVGLCYMESSPIRVRGLVSGRSYEFAGAHAVQEVDVRDASSLLNTRFFRRA